MYESFTIEQIIEIRRVLGVAFVCDGDRGWFNCEDEE